MRGEGSELRFSVVMSIHCCYSTLLFLFSHFVPPFLPRAQHAGMSCCWFFSTIQGQVLCILLKLSSLEALRLNVCCPSQSLGLARLNFPEVQALRTLDPAHLLPLFPALLDPSPQLSIILASMYWALTFEPHTLLRRQRVTSSSQ